MNIQYYTVAKVFLSQFRISSSFRNLINLESMGCCPPASNSITPSIIQRREIKFRKIDGRNSVNSQIVENIRNVELQFTLADKYMLNKTISSHCFLFRLPNSERDRLIECFDTYQCQEDAIIFKKNEAANFFFIIKSGKVKVIVNPQDKNAYNILERGDYFGDLALLYAAPRSATVVALTKCQFYCISHQIFRRTAQEIVKKNYELTKKFIEKVVIFKFLTKREKTLIAYNSLVLKYEKDAIIFKEGDDANSFFVVTGGKVQLSIPEKSSYQIGIGESFGENSFKKNQYRSGTALAIERTSLLSISRDSLRKCLGKQLEDISYYNILKWALSRDSVFKMATNIQREKLITSTEIIYKEEDDVICSEGQIANFIIIALQQQINYQEVGSIFNKQYLFSENENDLKITKKIVKNKPGNIGKISFACISEIFGKKLAGLVNKTASKEAMLQFSTHKKQYINSLNLSDLTVKTKLGQGQFGKVYLVEDKLGKKYAIKCIRKNKLIENSMESFVVKEKQILQLIDNPFIIKLYRTFKDEHFVYLLLNMINGADFFDLLREIGLCSKKKAQFYIGCYIIALQHLHQKNIIYRDLKPENAVVDERGYLYLIDLGIAKVLTQETGFRTFTVIGTPHYMSPQAIQLQGYTFSSDFWSLGVILYEMLCGELPFGNSLSDPYEIFRQIFSEELSFPNFYSESTGQQLLKKLLSKNPGDRFIEQFCHLKNNDFFQNFDWDSLTTKEMSPPLRVKSKIHNGMINQNLTKYLKKQKATLEAPLQSKMDDWDQQF